MHPMQSGSTRPHKGWPLGPTAVPWSEDVTIRYQEGMQLCLDMLYKWMPIEENVVDHLVCFLGEEHVVASLDLYLAKFRSNDRMGIWADLGPDEPAEYECNMFKRRRLTDDLDAGRHLRYDFPLPPVP